MRTAGQVFVAARQIAFFSSTGGGKLHAAWKVSGVPVCGAAVELNREIVVRSEVGKTVHPMCCRRCQRLSLSSGVSALGMEQ